MLARKLLPLIGAVGMVAPSLLGVGSAAPDQTRAAARVYLIDCRGDRAKVKPVNVVLACADDGAAVTRATWSHWGAAVATARAQLTENSCVPTCVAGTFVSEPARVTVRSIVRANGRYQYSHIRVVPDRPNPHHFKTISQSLPE